MEWKRDNFDIGHAIEHLRVGRRVTRLAWNGNRGVNDPRGAELWLRFVPARKRDNGEWSLEYVEMHTRDDAFVPWLCSQTDLLATDWSVLE